MKKCIKSIAQLLVITLIMASVPLGVFAHNHSINSEVLEDSMNLEDVEVNENWNEEFISEVSPYIELDKNEKSYSLTSEGKKELSKDQVKLVSEILKTTNKELKEIGKDFKENEDGVLEAEEITIQSNSNIRITYHWYGVNIHFSHRAVQVFKNNILLYGATVAGVNAAMLATFAAFSVSPPGWLASLVTAIALFGAWLFISRDKGCGVNVKLIWGSSLPTVWNAC